MLFITDTCTDPYRNLAEEEYLLKNFDEPIFRLWRNDNAIIVGLHQNTLAEIDYNFVKQNGIKVVRRLTGGGAVFHDLGNLNYTFIERTREKEDTAEMFKRFTLPIIEALNSIGVKAYLHGRNDLLIDEKKFSGNAVCIWKNRVLQHGTLLFDTSMQNLADALKSRPEKFVGKAVQSNRMRVTNIKEHLLKSDNQLVKSAKELDVLWFRDYLTDFISQKMKGDIQLYNFTPEQESEIDQLTAQKYSTERWNFGLSPDYSFSNVKKFDGGLLEFYFNVQEGIITELKVCGDYFFTLPTEEFTAQMVGTPHSKEQIAKKIGTLPISAYFSNISSTEIVEMFF